MWMENIFIFRERKRTGKAGGESTDYRREMEERNRKIYADYKNGMNTEMLSGKYFLSDKSIQRIIANEKRK